jgi:thiol-disulfide isomerase/thioredoxin
MRRRALQDLRIVVIQPLDPTIAIQRLDARAHPATEIAMTIGVDFDSVGLTHSRFADQHDTIAGTSEQRSVLEAEGTVIKKVSIITIIVVVVASLAIVAIAKYQRVVQPAIARGLAAAATDSGGGLANLEADTLIAADKAIAAPEFAKGNWINSDPLTLDKLRGRVVVVEFWTFGCFNCRNTLPSVKEWDAKYRDRGLTIVGVHTPETDSEYRIENVRKEVPALGIKYPVVTDNDYTTWKAYGVEAWPTMAVLDKQGRVRWLHVGEGRYEETENVIKTLLVE